VAVVFLILGTLPFLGVVALALLTLHDPVDGARRTILTVVVEVSSEFLLLKLAVTLVDVTVGVAIAPVLVEVGA
jgi:hypothetical protein